MSDRKLPAEDDGPVNILWFRHGLRLHDNPSLHEAVDLCRRSHTPEPEGGVAKTGGHAHVSLLPIFIFDGETAGTKLCGFNRFSYLLECLKDIDDQLRAVGGRLHIFKGDPISIFSKLNAERGINKLCFEQDCEPVWKTRDEKTKAWANDAGVEWVEKVGHTLWNPHEVISLNGGSPPLTFSMFNHVVQALGPPERPLPDLHLDEVTFAGIEKKLGNDLSLFEEFPTPKDFGVEPEGESSRVYIGGETNALRAFEIRIEHETKSFKEGSFLPNQREPDILCPPKSLSPDFRFGSLSVRKFYWGIIDAFRATQVGTNKPFNPQIVAQMLWREFFYTMSVNNEFYDEMDRNEMCINIDWYPADDTNSNWEAFRTGKTGYPFIDAGMRQLYSEGWCHHIVRNALACFLTRGDLWISWEAGLKLFLKHLLDADWSVCAGNWMWISSSAFEQVLSCGNCIDPSQYGRRADPWGNYIQKYVPELSAYPVEHIYEPWKAPIEVQKKAGCIVGKDYPAPIVEHHTVSRHNAKKMEELKKMLMGLAAEPVIHCAPSNEDETRKFMSFTDNCGNHNPKCIELECHKA